MPAVINGLINALVLANAVAGPRRSSGPEETARGRGFDQ
jgi:hypothetical protein